MSRSPILAALLLAAGTAQAANSEIFLDQGPDRAQRVLAQAKKEGVVVLYSTMTPEDANPLLAAFEKKHGVKVTMWRAVNQKLVQRALTEARAGRLAADVFEGSGPGLEILHREGHVTETFRFASIELMEPGKQEVLAWRAGDALPRHSFAVVWNRADNKTYETTVDLTGDAVLSFKLTGRPSVVASN